MGGASEVEAAWAIVPERWGQGLATELARAAVQAAFGELALPEIVAFALPDNHASRRVMDKTGFIFEREIAHAGRPHLLYRLRADPAARLLTSAPLTQSSEARKERVARPNGRPRPR